MAGTFSTTRQIIRVEGIIAPAKQTDLWAVRMARAGAPFELIARQLGHRDVAMVTKVYGRFKPDTEERDRWEHVAAARDQEKWHRPSSTEGANVEKLDQVETGSDWRSDSRGGTRTRDPGIMSAVL